MAIALFAVLVAACTSNAQTAPTSTNRSSAETSTSSSRTTTTTRSTGTTTTRPKVFGIEGIPIDPFAVQVGQCFNRYTFLQDYKPIEVASIRPCDLPHDAEMYAKRAVNEPSDAPYPEVAALNEIATLACYESFTDYVGLKFELSRYRIGIMLPPESRWANRAEPFRTIACYLTENRPSTKLNKSVRNARE